MRTLLALAAIVASPPDVQKLVLTPTQVGPSYVMIQRSDGRGVKNTVTLNVCGAASTYPSESRRLTRLQVDYLKQKSTLGLSNEVVTYRPGGAAQAMREVLQGALGLTEWSREPRTDVAHASAEELGAAQHTR